MERLDDTGVGEVMFAVGGAWQRAVQASKADVVVVFDSWEEVKRVPDAPHLMKVPLGDQDTVQSMLERLQGFAPESWTPLHEEYKAKPNVFLGAGMAQDPRIGTAAIWDLASQERPTENVR